MPPKEEKTKKTPRDLGILTAKSLLAEIRPPKMGYSPNDDKLFLSIPDRKSLRFAVSDDVPIARVELSTFPNEEQKQGIEVRGNDILFSCASGFVGPNGFFDVDHVFPFEKIKERQEKLLEYLNDPKNKEFKEGFMSVSDIKVFFNYGRKPGEKNKETGVVDISVTGKGLIYGTGRFFRACYNDLGNLMLLTHPDNMQKSAQSPEKWIEEQPMLGSACNTAINLQGGLHNGVIVQKVFNTVGCKELVIGENKDGEEIKITLHAGKQTTGGGEFIRRWFEKNNPGCAELLSRAYTNIWENFQKTLLSHSKVSPSRPASVKSKLTRSFREAEIMIERSIGLISKKAHDIISPKGRASASPQLGDVSSRFGISPSSDTEEQANLRGSITEDFFRGAFDLMYRVKQSYNFIRLELNLGKSPEIEKAFEKEFYLGLLKLKIFSMDTETRVKFFDEFNRALKDKFQQADGKRPGAVMKIMEEIKSFVDPSRELKLRIQAAEQYAIDAEIAKRLAELKGEQKVERVTMEGEEKVERVEITTIEKYERQKLMTQFEEQQRNSPPLNASAQQGGQPAPTGQQPKPSEEEGSRPPSPSSGPKQ